jgi:hypothetical protein
MPNIYAGLIWLWRFDLIMRRFDLIMASLAGLIAFGEAGFDLICLARQTKS